MGISRITQLFGNALAPTAIVSPCPADGMVVTEEAGWSFVAPGKDLWFQKCALQRTPNHLTHHLHLRQIEPDDMFCPRPDDRPGFGIAACDNPIIALCRVIDRLTEGFGVFGGPIIPIRAPVEQVELDHPQASGLSQTLGKGAFPCPRSADDHYVHCRSTAFTRVKHAFALYISL
jgi:hypothetical protein